MLKADEGHVNPHLQTSKNARMVGDFRRFNPKPELRSCGSEEKRLDGNPGRWILGQDI
jgi:hypothetical protein